MSISRILSTHKCRYLWAGLSLLLIAPSITQADELDAPFDTANRSPFVQIYGLPSASSGQLIQASNTQWQLHFDTASSAFTNSRSEESITLDGETQRLELRFNHGLSSKLEVGFNLPYVRHNAGHLDSFIDSWHKAFSLPEGDRPEQMKNQFNYTYSRAGTPVVALNRDSSGIGDINLNLGYQLSSKPNRQWALRGGIKLPTGNADELHGSESTDIYLGAHVSDQSLLSAYNIALHASAGALWMSSGEVLDQAREDWVVYASSTLSWRYRQRLRFKAQLDFHSAFYDSAVKPLGDASAQLVLGAALELSERWLLDLSVSEDIIVSTSPDVVFQLGLTLRP